MKTLFCLSAALLLLAACGNDDPASEAVSEAPAIDPAAEVVDTAPAPAERDDEEEVLEVVEESAAEVDPDEQKIVLAQADSEEVKTESEFVEGKHYVRLVPAQPTVGGGDKVEVAEFFWYGCPHCFDFERYINRWAEDKPKNVRFVRVPAMWNRGLQLHAQLFYTEELLAKNGVIEDPEAFREAVFKEYHARGNRLASKDAIQEFFARFDVGEEEFESAWSSFEVDQKLRMAESLARRYAISGVPAVVVNGKYRSGGQEAGGYDSLLDLIDELVARESQR